MNILLSSWDVPTFNFLGALDHGSGLGHWAQGFWNDGWHPNAAGHYELFLSIVPSSFEAVVEGKPRPERASGDQFLTVGSNLAAPISFVPGADVMHSFSLVFRVKKKKPKTEMKILFLPSPPHLPPPLRFPLTNPPCSYYIIYIISEIPPTATNTHTRTHTQTRKNV